MKLMLNQAQPGLMGGFDPSFGGDAATGKPRRRRAIIARMAIAFAVAFLTAVGVSGQIDRASERDPNWPPSPTRDTETYYRTRIGKGLTPFNPARPDEVAEARNPRDAASQVDAANRKTTPHDLDVIRKDGQPGVGYSQLSVDPVDGSADRSGRNYVEKGLDGAFLNNDPRSRAYLLNAKRQMNLANVTRNWQWAFGSPRFIRTVASGNLKGSIRGGEASHEALGEIDGIFFGRSRNLIEASLTSKAPASDTAVRSATLKISVLGRNVVNETVSDKAPFVKNLRRFNLADLPYWFSGAIKVPWLGLELAFKMSPDPISVTPRVAVGYASVAGEAAINTGLSTLAELPLYSLYGFATVLARIDFRPISGELSGGNSIGLAWSGASPLMRDARYARVRLSYGDVNLKIKAVVGFKVFGFGFKKDKTLWSVFKHPGKSTSRELVSYVREVPLR